MNLDARLLRLTQTARLPLMLTIAAGTATGVCVVFQARVLSQTINAVFLQAETLFDVRPLLIKFLLISLLRSILRWASDAAAITGAASLKQDLRKRLVDHFTRLGPVYLRERRSGELATLALDGIEALHAYFAEYIPQLALAAFVPLTLLIFVLPLDWVSGLVLFFTAPLIPLFMALIGEAANRLTQRQWDALSSLSSNLLDRLQGLTTLKLLGRSQAEVALLRRSSMEFRDRTMAVLRVAFLSALVLEWIATLSTAVVAVEIGLRLLSGNLDFESAFFVLLLAPEFYIPLRMLGLRFHAGAAGAAAAAHIFDILEQKPRSEASGVQRSIPRDADLTFQNVFYRYPGSKRLSLQELSFTWNAGETLALVGPSGGGKSTIANLLLGFDQPTQGSILVSGVDLSCFNPSTWRHLIAFVPQNPYLFMGSIEQNLRLADPQASQAALIDACAQADALAFIERLPNGFQTMIGERGLRLSGGQAQRLSLARAFIQNAPRIILDEATANLDPGSEDRIHAAIQRLQTDRTTLIIAHRLRTTLSADRVLVLHQGRILESGSPQGLLEQQGAYWRMMRAYQAGIEMGAAS